MHGQNGYQVFNVSGNEKQFKSIAIAHIQHCT